MGVALELGFINADRINNNIRFRCVLFMYVLRTYVQYIQYSTSSKSKSM